VKHSRWRQLEVPHLLSVNIREIELIEQRWIDCVRRVSSSWSRRVHHAAVAPVIADENLYGYDALRRCYQSRFMLLDLLPFGLVAAVLLIKLSSQKLPTTQRFLFSHLKPYFDLSLRQPQ
jgi:hypothetical protein